MRQIRNVLIAVLLLSCMAVLPATAQASRAKADSADKAAITRTLYDSAVAWNKGDIRTFMESYVDSPETTFVGKTVTYGWQNVLDRYLKNYSSQEKMGHLDFSDLAIRLLDAKTAVVTGRFKLTRSAAGGGDASGIYSLVFLKTAQGWKITLDHSVSD
jgi:ketosteroid isomerase-like protein